ncbi:hypothetical protein BH18ACT2_BH18ACT2_18890 [soil metagenome]
MESPDDVDALDALDALDAPLAPPVVAVVVVHDPGPWFNESLAALAAQDYPNLNTLFLVAGGANAHDDAEVEERRILARLPAAFVRPLGANPGYGAAANEVLRLVEGDNGFFCFCHDDVALDPDAIRMLVEELYRSNAGVVGPKLVSWDDPGLLQHVGLGLDRFGEIDPIIEAEGGEYDQEQHDRVADVFVLPSACLLVRADLFRTLGGFDPAIDFHGDDVDFCWRMHLRGARVVVAPQARARHREELEVRRPELHHDLLRARHRMRTVVTLTSSGRLPLRGLEMILLTTAELAVGAFTGRLGEAWSSVRAFVGLVPRLPAVLARRGAVAKIRDVGDTEILGLQNRGSARLTSYRRARDHATYVGAETNVRRWRESTLAVTVTWLIVLLGIVLASRTLIDTRVPAIGELLPLPDSARDLLGDYASAWNPGGLGNTVANPTGWAVVSVASVLWLFRMGLGLTFLVIGLVVLGVWGAWRLATVFPTNRARITVLVVYATVPLLPGVISTGRLSALVAYAAVPWFVHLLRTSVGIGTADPAAADVDLVDGVIALAGRERLRRAALTAVVVGLAVAMAPAVALILVTVAIVLGLTTLLAGAGWRTAAWMTGLGMAAVAVGFALNLPWALTWSWDDLTATPLAGPLGRGLVDTAAMAVGPTRFDVLAVALYVPVLVALAVSRAWRLTWAARAAGLVVVFLGLAVLQDRDALPFPVPETGLLLVPVALGLAVSAAAAVAAFGTDVTGRTFGWRQPLSLLSMGAVVVGVTPAVFTVLDGSWYLPPVSTLDLTEGELPAPSDGGDYRVLYVGDPRLIPFPSTDLGDGVAMALVESGRSDLRRRWPVADQAADESLRAAVTAIADSSTRRGGRLLAPFGIRFVVVPLIDGVRSTADEPLPVPAGLLDALSAQLDLGRSIATATNFVRFDNRSSIPTAAVLDPVLAEASTAGSPAALVGIDTAGATPVLPGVLETRRSGGELVPGVVHLATPLDGGWRLEQGGQDVPARASFGVSSAFDLAAAGPAELSYAGPASRRVWLILQAALWVLVLLAASRLTVPARLRMIRGRDETLIDLDAEPAAPLPAPVGSSR